MNLPMKLNNKFRVLSLAIGSAFLLTACGPEKTYWVVRTEPTTEAEHRAVAEQVAKIMAAAPRTLSGNDQDWDDAIKAATVSAKETICRPTIWEHHGYGVWTGQWRYVSENK